MTNTVEPDKPTDEERWRQAERNDLIEIFDKVIADITSAMEVFETRGTEKIHHEGRIAGFEGAIRVLRHRGV